MANDEETFTNRSWNRLHRKKHGKESKQLVDILHKQTKKFRLSVPLLQIEMTTLDLQNSWILICLF